MLPELYPLMFKPIYKETIWGGRRLEKILDRALPTGLIGESWDVAAHDHGNSVVASGALKGKSLSELVVLYGEDLLGKKGVNKQGKFPLLLKLIDANQDLSVQVHPDDLYASKHTAETWGKTEMWYIVHSEPNAWIIWGLREGITKEEMSSALKKGGEAVLNCLNKVYVKPGEIYPISAGLVHALGAGVVVLEVQQNSDTTYRFYDWDRLDDKGNPRELHLEHALNVTDFSLQGQDMTYQYNRCSDFFKFEILHKPQNFTVKMDESFHILTFFEENGEINLDGKTTKIKSGQSVLMPRCLEQYSFSTNGVVLQSSLP